MRCDHEFKSVEAQEIHRSPTAVLLPDCMMLEELFCTQCRRVIGPLLTIACIKCEFAVPNVERVQQAAPVQYHFPAFFSPTARFSQVLPDSHQQCFFLGAKMGVSLSRRRVPHFQLQLRHLPRSSPRNDLPRFLLRAVRLLCRLMVQHFVARRSFAGFFQRLREAYYYLGINVSRDGE